MFGGVKCVELMFHVLLVVSLGFIMTEARPFNILKVVRNGEVAKLEGFFDGLAIKSGPSPGGQGNAQTLGGIKQSGPSPGEGHKFTDTKTLGGIKQSGPSPGEGHKFTDTKTLGGIKDSGPSPGAGHSSTTTETLGGIKDSGPSPGAGHSFTTTKPLGGIKVSGPSPRGRGHSFTTTEKTLGGIKGSGLSPSDRLGTKIESLVDRKDGPSPGEGHNYITGQHQ